ncbi:PRC-barrel domain-containing protein [Thioalkalivibrio sp. ALMg11]|uniref:PRC-barrel domain-containing protein n=1 Tax=Thioalkalivibrio sp. ALMg11 TaxID=1158165 RepID=UPI000371C5DF|nr:PRC-barrel domain-containing protein [Thioalkalivibrio sp. ALMg11]
MKKLYSFALYALVAPAMTLGASSVLAQDQQERTDQDADRGAQSMERDQGATQYNDRDRERGAQRDKGDKDFGMEGRAEDRRDAGDELAERKGYLESAPADGMQASDIMGTDVKTAGDENLGSVDDLIIDENGQVVAIVVGVGGFLGIGEKDVAIGWGHVTTSGTADDRELRVDVTREELRDAPEFERRD